MGIALVILGTIMLTIASISVMYVATERLNEAYQKDMARHEAIHKANMVFLEATQNLGLVEDAHPEICRELGKAVLSFGRKDFPKCHRHLKLVGLYTCPRTAEKWEEAYKAFLEVKKVNECT